MLGITLDADDVVDYLQACWDETAEDDRVPFKSAPDEHALQSQAADLVRAYIGQVPADEPRPVAVEAALEAPLVDPWTDQKLDIPLIGIVDLILDG